MLKKIQHKSLKSLVHLNDQPHTLYQQEPTIPHKKYSIMSYFSTSLNNKIDASDAEDTAIKPTGRTILGNDNQKYQ